VTRRRADRVARLAPTAGGRRGHGRVGRTHVGDLLSALHLDAAERAGSLRSAERMTSYGGALCSREQVPRRHDRDAEGSGILKQIK